jgi:UDP-3-O-[3-hydroxymyristoyl] glucosamine N-acyltransferase
MKLAVISFSAVLLAFVAWTASPVSQAGNGRSITTVNGQVEAEDGQTYETLSTVNGQVRVGRGVTAKEAKTVNGQVLIEEDVKLGKASTVNGQLRIGQRSIIEHEASTVNGGVKLDKGARVGGNLSTVSGGIDLDGAEVGGSVTTHNGDIELSDGAHVRGDIVVKKKNDTGWSWGKDEPIEVRICASCVVDGDLRFERPVELYVQPGAKIGKVIGDSVTRR